MAEEEVELHRDEDAEEGEEERVAGDRGLVVEVAVAERAGVEAAAKGNRHFKTLLLCYRCVVGSWLVIALTAVMVVGVVAFAGCCHVIST